MAVDGLATIIQVSDLDAAIGFYTDTLGFTECFRYGEPPYYAIINMGSAIFHQNSGEEGAALLGTARSYIAVDEVDSYYQEPCEKGVKITTELASYPYGMRDFQLADPDGNRICFGAPVHAE